MNDTIFRKRLFAIVAIVYGLAMIGCSETPSSTNDTDNGTQPAQTATDSTEISTDEVISSLAIFSGGKLKEVVNNVNFGEFAQGFGEGLEATDIANENISPSIEDMSNALAQVEQQHLETKQAVDLTDANVSIVSFALGFLQGTQLKQLGIEEADPQQFLDNFQNAYAEGVTDFAPLTEKIEAFFQQLQQRQSEQAMAENSAAREVGEAFLAQNRTKVGVNQTDSGLQYEILVKGDGPMPQNATDKVRVHYVGQLIDGSEFDSSYQRGEPTEFALNRVITGWTEGLQLMNVGSKYRFYIPFDLGYGASGAPPSIPPYATLIFDVELLDIL